MQIAEIGFSSTRPRVCRDLMNFFHENIRKEVVVYMYSFYLVQRSLSYFIKTGSLSTNSQLRQLEFCLNCDCLLDCVLTCICELRRSTHEGPRIFLILVTPWAYRMTITVPIIMRVGIVGAGISGIVAGAHLQNTDIDTTVFERNREAGGVW